MVSVYSNGYLECYGTKYDLVNGFWRMWWSYGGLTESKIIVTSNGVTYSSFFDDITGNGNGVGFTITHDKEFTSLTGNQDFTFGMGDEPYHIYMAKVHLNYDFWLNRGISYNIANGILIFSDSSSVYTLDFNGQDEEGKTVTFYYLGLLKDIN